MISFPGASALFSRISYHIARRVSSPRRDFLGKNHCPALGRPPILLSDGRFPARHARRPKNHCPAMGQTASRAFFAPFLPSPHASRAPGILSLLQKPSPGAVAVALRRSGWMTRRMRCASRGKRPPGGARVTRVAARSSRPHALHGRKGQRKIERACIQPYAYAYACTRAPACSNEKENYLKITCCSLR